MQHTYIKEDTRAYHANEVLRQTIAYLFLYLEQERSNDEKKLVSLLEESQEERDELISEQVLIINNRFSSKQQSLYSLATNT
jgi:hypothetical protein